jgi:hypothetical protein
MYDVLPSLTSKVGKLPRPWIAMTSFMRSLSLRGRGGIMTMTKRIKKIFLIMIMAMITAMITPRGYASTMTMILDKIPILNSISNRSKARF